MALPASIEPFVEPDSGHGWWAHVASRALRHPLWIVLACAGMTLLLWIDAAGEGIVPGPAASPRLLAGFLVATGVAAAWAVLSELDDGHTTLRQEVTPETPRLPVFLRFDQHQVVVVGGGNVAASKVPALLAAGAQVTVIAPHVSAAIDRSRVHVVERAFTPSDLDGAWFVTAAATPEVNRAVREAADRRAIFVNAVDDPANATAYLGGTIARGGVTVAFSTSGRAPALAGLLREAFDDLLPADIDAWVERANQLRNEQRREGVPMQARRPALLEALNHLYSSEDLSAEARRAQVDARRVKVDGNMGQHPS